MTPEAFGKYVVVEVIGRGGMADVYLARHRTLDRDVAIKAIHPHLATEAGFTERFNREARLVASLRHPGIVQVHDFDVADGRPYMVMEFVGGGTLKDRLASVRAERGPMSPAEAARYLVPIADALDYAHARGAIHRDLKPANILLTTAGAPVLSDFGIARILEDAAFTTATGTLVGTPAYMSPEQAAGRPVDARSDQYSLGIVVYEMTTGRVPFAGGSPTAVMLQHLQDPPPDPCMVNPDLSAAVRAVLLRALAKDPADRFISAGEMARAFATAAGTGGDEAATAVVAAPDAPTVAVPVDAAGAGDATAAATAATVVPGAAPVDATADAAATVVPGAAPVPRAAPQPGPTVVAAQAPAGGSGGSPAPPAGSAGRARARPASVSGRRRVAEAAAASVVLVCVLGGVLLVTGRWPGGGSSASPGPSAAGIVDAPGATASAAAGAARPDAPAGSATVLPPPATSLAPTPSGAPVPPTAAASPGASAAATAAVAATPQPTPTLVPSNPAVVTPGKCPSARDAVAYRADFARAGAGWPVRTDGMVHTAYTDGAYRVTVIEPYHWWSAYYEPDTMSARYAVQLRTWPAAGRGTGAYGLYFSATDKDDNFQLEIRDAGEYRVVKTAAGRPADLVPWTATGRLDPGGSNTLAVAVRGSVATICINGTAVTAVKDPDLRTGRIGMVAETEAEQLDVLFDDFTLYALK